MASTERHPSHKTLASIIGKEHPLSLPRISYVIVNVGVGRRVVAEGEKALEPIVYDLMRITGQKPAVRPARKSVASFKLRKGQAAGLIVTLRGKRARDFITRLIRIALPRTRDFRGIRLSGIDGRGNLNIGIREQTVFPEAARDPTGALFGLQVTIVTTARNRREAEAFYRFLGFPLQSSAPSP